MINLISNSIKFTIKGKIEVIASLEFGNIIKCEVIDTGVGSISFL